MSDFNELLAQIHKSLEQEEKIEDAELDLTVSDDAEASFDSIGEDVAAEEDVTVAEEPVKEVVSQFRKNEGGYVEVSGDSDSISSVASFADRYAQAENEKKTTEEDAFVKFMKARKSATDEKPTSAETDSAIDELNASVMGEKKPVAEPEEPTKPVSFPADATEEEEEIKVADKSAILQQLATAETGGIDDEELRKIDEEVANSISAREADNSEPEEYEEEKGKAGLGKIKELFSGDAIRNWRLRFDHLDPSLNKFKCDEYSDPATLDDKRTKLAAERRLLLIRLIAEGAIALILMIMNIATSVSAAKNPDRGFAVYCILNIVFLLGSAGVAFPEFKSGVIAALRLKPKASTSLVVAYLAVLVQCFCGIFVQKVQLENGVHLLTAAAVLLTVPVLLAKEYYYSNLNTMLRHCSAPSDRGVLRDISDDSTANEMLRDSQAERKDIRYPGKTRFISGIIATAADASASSELRGRFDAIFILVSFVIGIVAWISSGSFMIAVTAATAGIIFSFPAGCLLASGIMLDTENKKSAEKGIFVASVGQAQDVINTKNIVVNDKDLFTAEITDSVTIRSVSSAQADYVAAILANRAGGVFARAFAKEIEENKDRFPFVEEFAAESRLGISGWITDCKILLGNAAFMENHSIDIPFASINDLLKPDTQKLYLSINGTFAAAFALHYSPVEAVVANLRNAVKRGTNLIIVATDPNLSDDVIEKMLSFPSDSVRVLAPSGLENFIEERNEVTVSEKTGFMFAPDFAGFTDALGSALRIGGNGKLMHTLTFATSIVGLVMALVFALVSSVDSHNNGFTFWVALILDAVFIAAAIFIPDRLISTVRTQGRVRPVQIARTVARPASVEEDDDSDDLSPVPAQAASAPAAAPAVTSAPVYVAVNETPDPEESTVTPPELAPREKTEEEKEKEFNDLIAYLDRPSTPYVPRKKTSFFGFIGEMAKDTAEKAKDTAGKASEKAKSGFGKISEKRPQTGESVAEKAKNGLGKLSSIGEKIKNRRDSYEDDYDAYEEEYEDDYEEDDSFSDTFAEARSREDRRRSKGDFYNTGKSADEEDYDFAGRYSGDNMFSGLDEE